MKTFAKQLLIALLLTVAAPAFAAEGPTKGTKSYQSARADKTEQTQPQAEGAQPDLNQIAPAAGDTAETQKAEQVKTMREEMRLPRKN